MNTFLPSRYDERILRGAVALQLWDGARDARLPATADVLIEREDAALPQWSLDQAIGEPDDADAEGRYRFPKRPTRRHAVNLHAIVYPQPLPPGRPAPPPKVAFEVRVVDTRGQYVPRRLRLPIPAAADPDDAGRPLLRIRRAALFPAAPYDLVSGSTGIRGRVTVAGRPVRWARVVVPAASGAATDPPRAVAHGDEKGEFLLIMPPAAGATLSAASTFSLPLTIGVPPALTPALELAIRRDRLSDVPLETIGPAQVIAGSAPPRPAPDRVAMGWAMPAAYTIHNEGPITLTAGRLRREKFDY
jgi:hypothetical protein